MSLDKSELTNLLIEVLEHHDVEDAEEVADSIVERLDEEGLLDEDEC
jgi:hypothetical protein